MMLVRRSVAQFRPLVTDREGGLGRGEGGERARIGDDIK